MNILIIILSTLTIATPSHENLTLKSALGKAISNSSTLREKYHMIEIQKGLKKVEKGQFDVMYQATLNTSYMNSEPVGGSFMSVTGQKSISLDFGISKRLSSGGVISLKSSNSWNSTEQIIDMSSMTGNTALSEIDTTTKKGSLLFSISHPLLAGMGTEINQAQIKKVEKNVEIEELNFQIAAENLVRDVAVAWMDLDLAWKQLRVHQSSLKSMKVQLENTKILIEAGMGKKSDLLAVQSALAQKKLDYTMAENVIVKASLKLADLMGVKIAGGFKPYKPVSVFALEVNVSNLVKKSIKRSKGLLVLKKQLENNNLDMKVARNSLLPRVDFNITAGPSIESERFVDTVKNLYKFNGYMVGAGISVSGVFERRSAKGNVDRVRASSELIKIKKDKVENQLAMSAVLSETDYKSAGKMILAAELAVKAAAIHLENEILLFKSGKSTNHSILLRMTELDVAKLSLERARHDQNVAMQQIMALSGEILPKYGIKNISENR
ncbi:MAG: TolC family protein [Deltaproteobacteria bacterium]|nr:TolC family protein [Deltaproteobacteria bacterium]